MGLFQRLTNALGQRKNCSLSLEIAAYLITFEKHEEWLTTSPKTRPQNGSMILYNRKKVKYRKDGYCWKKRKDGKTTREDHMKLKVQGVERCAGNIKGAGAQSQKKGTSEEGAKLCPSPHPAP
ncbi:hypothetical protein MATL_G00072460 [Megalops atlanticus]|uniref:CG-1 domain-containing protein n=1 Tax=Megalops atlanticus TaxID=7932 RepID=A0A9D3QA29_MEGAT|nr:hypothetical protein MATL_G00072460 [Megalops atlanticus]